MNEKYFVEYLSLLDGKFEDGRISFERYEFLAGKLLQWSSNKNKR